MDTNTGLTEDTLAAEIEGIQHEGLMATVKHFALNNSEFDRRNLSSDIDERTLREIYLVPFELAFAIEFPGPYTLADLDKLLSRGIEQWKAFEPLSKEELAELIQIPPRN